MVKRIIYIILGSIVSGLGIAMMAKGTLGVDTLSVFMLGIAKLFNLPFSYANALVNLSIIGIVFLKDRKIIGIGSLINACMIAFTIHLSSDVIETIIVSNDILNYIVIIIGPICIGVGAAIYVNQNLGAAALESLTLCLCGMIKKLNLKTARILLDFTFALLGMIIGGPIGLGTVTTVILVGPTVFKVSKLLKGNSEYENNNVSM
jgi:uncharacterized membrane protein YczE